MARVGVAVAAILVFVFAGCSKLQRTDRIADVLAKAEGNLGGTVTVHGHVVEVVAAMGYGLYKVQDDSGAIWVRSGNVPSKGQEVTLGGTLQAGFTVLGTSIGYHIKEEWCDRSAPPAR